MLSEANIWMCFAGLLYLVVGVFLLRKDISAARRWDKLIILGCVFYAVPLAIFAPEHFQGPEFVKNMVPSYMPARWFWAYFIGCALLAAAASLTLRKLVRLSSVLLGTMFTLFVCMLYIPFVVAHPESRFAWAIALRDLSFAAGAWALAGLQNRALWPRESKWMILFGRFVLAIAAIFCAVEHFLHPEFAPGVPLEKVMPPWIPFARLWGYLAGAILLIAGIGLALNKQPRKAAASIGALMTVLTVFPYLLILIFARGASDINEAINYVADTWLYGGAALLVASALPSDQDRDEKT